MCRQHKRVISSFMDHECVSQLPVRLRKASPTEECRDLPATPANHWHRRRTCDTVMTHAEGNPPRENSTPAPAEAVNHLRVSVSERGTREKPLNVLCQQRHTKLISGVSAGGDRQKAAFKKSSPILPSIKLSAVF